MWKNVEDKKAYYRMYYLNKKKEKETEPEPKKEYSSKRKDYMREYMRHYKKYGKGFRKEKQEIRLQECYVERLSGTTELLEMEIAWLEMTGTTSTNEEKHKAYNAWKYQIDKRDGKFVERRKISKKERYKARKEGMPIYNPNFLPYIESLLGDIKNKNKNKNGN